MAQLTDEQLDEIADAIISGNKIHAIKQYREATGTGLKEAKEAIEGITESLAKDHPELLSRKAGGCASLIVFGVGIAYLLSPLGPFGLS